MTDLDVARRALRCEIAGLEALAAGLDEAFARAVAVLDRAAPGRIIVSGMGKSGHVGRKIAATLSSLGAPAVFVHPSEASHGDLGMVTQGDAIVLLSNSGETGELDDLVAHARRMGIGLVAITAGAASTLAENADVALVLPAVEEACPLRLAPTTSTTMMMALGDALAIALLEKRGFTEDDFRALHPGGRLGRRLVRVRDLMHAGDELPLVGPDAPMADAILEMTRKRFGCVGIVDSAHRLVGIITDGDLRRHMAPDILGRPVASVMTAAPRTIRADALAGEAMAVMNDNRITALFVVENERPAGILHIHDCLREGVA